MNATKTRDPGVLTFSFVVCLVGLLLGATQLQAQEVLPFPEPPSASTTGKTLADSKHQSRKPKNHLPKDAPNIVIFMTDDAGFSHPEVFGGPVHMPTMARLAESGISYNAFHTTAMCSPTRASLLTGRNHHRVGNGQVAEAATDWDGYVGRIPKSTALFAEVLNHYGYNTAAFGKWHNTPVTELTEIGPFDNWPTGLGFDHFYGFFGGETSQYEPGLIQNTNTIEAPHDDPKYHLTEDLTKNAIKWIRTSHTFTPGKPFFIYFAPGAVHGPHHIFKEWADKYDGKFDEGWEVLRSMTIKKQKELGWIPQDAVLNPLAESMEKWDDIPESQRDFQIRLMEIFAGYLEHTDVQYGKIVDEIERQGLLENTLIIYIHSDNGPSAEGIRGTISEMLSLNSMASTIDQQIEVLNKDYGGIDALGGPKMENMYHSSWANGGATPFQGTKLVAAYLGGTRTPMVISWPAKIKHDGKVRSQFHHVNDIAATIYDILDITPAKVVNGIEQQPLDGISMVYTFDNPEAKTTKTTQYFEIIGSRGVYHEGWFAGTFGPRTPWSDGMAGILDWKPENDVWELYNLEEDYSQSKDLAKENPEKLAELKAVFDKEATENLVYPIGAGLYGMYYDTTALPSFPHTEWSFYDGQTRIPEEMAPKFVSGRSTLAVIDAEMPKNAEGVLFVLGGTSSGFTVYMDKGVLHAEYNCMTLNRYKFSSKTPIPTGKVKIEVETKYDSKEREAPATLTLKVNGKQVAQGRIERSVPGSHTVSDTFDIGMDANAPVSLDYYDRAPFKFNGKIEKVYVKYLKQNTPRKGKRMNTTKKYRPIVLTLSALTLASVAMAQEPKYAADVPEFLLTPDKVETDLLGDLEFFDGMPSESTVKKSYDFLDLSRGVHAFLNGMPATSTYAFLEGLKQAGLKPGDLGLTESLLDARGLLLTAQSTTPYAMAEIDLKNGPVVVEIPGPVLGILDDAFMRYVCDIGLAGPDQGKGGKYLLVGPDYEGDIPEGYFVAKSTTHRQWLLMRVFVKDGDLEGSVKELKEGFRCYPLAQADNPPKQKVVDLSGVKFNTIHANDEHFYEELNAVIQYEPADAFNPELVGLFASIGIKKGEPFAPDARMKKILKDAAAIGNASARALAFRPRNAALYYYPDRRWYTSFSGGYDFMNNGEMVLDDRIIMHFVATGITPAMVTPKVGTGSSYAFTPHDANGDYLDGGKTYEVTLPAPIPVNNFWSFMVYSGQHRSMLETDQKLAGLDSNSPSIKPNDDDSYTVWFGPKAPEGHEGNWIQTMPGKSYNVLLRLYGPLEPWFDKTWKPGDFELVKQPPSIPTLLID